MESSGRWSLSYGRADAQVQDKSRQVKVVCAGPTAYNQRHSFVFFGTRNPFFLVLQEFLYTAVCTTASFFNLWLFDGSLAPTRRGFSPWEWLVPWLALPQSFGLCALSFSFFLFITLFSPMQALQVDGNYAMRVDGFWKDAAELQIFFSQLALHRENPFFRL